MIKRPIMVGGIFFFSGIIGSYYHCIWLILVLGVIAFWQLHTKPPAKYWIYILIFMCFGLLGYGRMEIRQQNGEQQLKSRNSNKEIQGLVVKKEEKNNQFYYYIQQKDCQILAISSQNQIPIHATVVAKGTPYLFQEQRNDGSYNESSYYKSLNCIYKIKNTKININQRPVLDLYESLYQLRCKLLTVIKRALPEREENVLIAMLTGEKNGLDPEIKEVYNKAGISHLLAISGTHLSILILGCYQLLRKRKISYSKAVLVSGIFLTGFSIMSGLSISTVRAAIMMSLFLLSQLLGASYDGLTGLSIAAVIILLFQPLAFLAISFQFSFLAAYGAISAGKILRLWFKKINPLLALIFMSGWITFLCFPLNIEHSYLFSTYQVMINALVLPFAGILLGVGMLGSWIAVLFFPLGKIILAPCGWILSYYFWIAKNIPKLPFGQILIGKPKTGFVIAYLLLAIILVYRLQDHPVRKWIKPQGAVQISKKNKKSYLVLIFGLIICFSGICLVRGERERVTMLDVGQGDGLHFYSDQKNIMIDGGSVSEKEIGKYTLIPYFNYHKINQIDCWFITHCDKDHYCGLYEVVEAGVKIKTVVFSQDVEKNANYEKLKKRLISKKITILYMDDNENCRIGKLNFISLKGREEGKVYDCNEKSLILKVEGKDGFTGFFGGDISHSNEKLITKYHNGEGFTVLKLNHHGSDQSNSEEFLKWAKADVVMISAGEHNRYNHPGKDTINRLQRLRYKWYLTSRVGQIDIFLKDRLIGVKKSN